MRGNEEEAQEHNVTRAILDGAHWVDWDGEYDEEGDHVPGVLATGRGRGCRGDAKGHDSVGCSSPVMARAWWREEARIEEPKLLCSSSCLGA